MIIDHIAFIDFLFAKIEILKLVLGLFSDVIFDEDAETSITRHDSTTNMTSVSNTGTAGLACRIFYVEHTHRVALYVTLLGGLAYAEHDLPPRSDFKERSPIGAVSFGFTHILLILRSSDSGLG